VVAALCLVLPGRAGSDTCQDAASDRFVGPEGGRPGSGAFALVEWVLPGEVPARAWAPVTVRFVRLTRDTTLSVLAGLAGDWGDSATWPLVPVRGARADTLIGTATIEAPGDTGQFRVRLILRLQSRWEEDARFTFEGCCDQCAWSEATIRVVPAAPAPHGDSQPQAGAETAQTPARPRPAGSLLPDAIRGAEKAHLDSLRAARLITEGDYRAKMRYLGTEYNAAM